MTITRLRRLWIAAVLILSSGVGAICPAAEPQLHAIIQRWGIDDAREPIAYHPETARLLTSHDGSAVLWDVPSGLAIRHITSSSGKSAPILSLGFTSDGRRILIGGGGTLQLHDTESGRRIVELELSKALVIDAALSPDGNSIAAACQDGRVRIWDVSSGRLIHALEGHRYEALTVRFSPDGQTLISGGADHLAILWDVETGKVLHRCLSPVEVRRTAFRRDGKRMLTSGSGNYWHTPRVVVWDIESGLPLQIIPRTARDAWFEDEQVVLRLPDGRVEIWPVDRHERAPDPEDAPKYSLNPKERWLIGSNHWALHVQLEPTTATLHGPSSKGHRSQRMPIALPSSGAEQQIPLTVSPDGRWLLARTRDAFGRCNVVLWDLQQAQRVQVFESAVFGALHPTRSWAVVGTGQKLTLYDFLSNDALQTYERQGGSFESVQFTHGGKRLLTASGDWYDGDGGQILAWDTETGERLRNYAPSEKAVLQARMTPDDRLIVASLTPGDTGSAGVDEISIFNAETGERVRQSSHPNYGFYGGLSASTGKHIVGHRDRKETLVWDVDGFQLLGRFPGIPGEISFDGSILATYSREGRLDFWATEGGQSLGAHFVSLTNPDSSFFHPGGVHYVASTGPEAAQDSGAGRSLGFWDLRTGRLDAEFFVFDGGREWLIQCVTGDMSGSEGGRRRIAWREGTMDPVTRLPKRTRKSHQPAKVARVLTRSSPPGTKLADRLAESLSPLENPLEASPPQDQATSGPQRAPTVHEISRIKREQVLKLLREAQAQLRITIHGRVTFIHLEKREVSEELIRQLPWMQATDRLYLADTGITDAQLEWVGLMLGVKRLSLWGNPITDDGLARIAALWNLEVLDVHDTNVTAEGLSRLHLLENLHTLIVPDHVDLDRLENLGRIPHLKIVPRGTSNRRNGQ